MRIRLNGREAEARDGDSVETLLLREGLLREDRPVAILRNDRVLPSAERSSTSLAEGDRIEVLSFLGGGA